MASPHDALFRYTFGQTEHAAPLLRTLLPPALAAAIDWSTLVAEPDGHVDGGLRRQHSDPLFPVRVGGRPTLLYLLLEHKARNEPWTALQVAGYVLALWRTLRRRRHRPRPKLLPPVVALVVHHGPRPFTAATDLRDLIDLDDLQEEARTALEPWLPRFRCLCLGLHGRSERELRALSMTLLGKLTLALLQFATQRQTVDIDGAVRRWADVARGVLRAPSGQEAIAALSSYLIETTPLDFEQIEVAVERHVDRKAAILMKTAAARLRAQGRAEGQAELLVRQLTARFGPLPATVTDRVRAAAERDLDRWAIALLTAPDLDAVFATE